MKKSLLILSVLMLTVTTAFAQEVDLNSTLLVTLDDTPGLNATACDDALEITIDLKSTYTALILQSTDLYAWLITTSSCDTFVKDETDSRFLAHQTLEVGEAPLIADQTFTFPEDLDTDLTFTTRTLMDFVDGCGDELVNNKVVTLCIAVDLPSDYASTDSIGYEDLWAGIAFEVDTLPPAAPGQPKMVGYDGRVILSVNSADDTDDASYWEARIQEATLDESGEPIPSDCSTWVEPSTSRGITGETSIEISAANGIMWEGCLIAIDGAGNISDPSETNFALAQEQCDFIECYPGDLETGYCGAGVTSLWSLLALVLLFRRRAR